MKITGDKLKGRQVYSGGGTGIRNWVGGRADGTISSGKNKIEGNAEVKYIGQVKATVKYTVDKQSK
jgi:uncharacterized protein YbjQ (UPF0145 family)